MEEKPKTQTKKTRPVSNGVEAQTHTVDAQGKKLGRLASEVAHLLMEKDNPSFEKYRKLGSKVIVTNASKLTISEKRGDEVRYKRASGYPGNLVEETINDAEDADVISVFVRSELRDDLLKQFSNLKLIATRSTGYDHIDISCAKDKGIDVVNVPTYGARTVAEFAFALMLALSRRAYEAYNELRTTGERDIAEFEGFDLVGKTLGVIGTGNIGKNIVRIARGFGMKVLAFDVKPDEVFAKELGFSYDSFENILAESDIVTLHVPLLDATRHMMNEKAFSQMKPGALLINTARGELVDTGALLKVLKSGHLAGAGLDVLEGERALGDELELLTSDVHDVKEIKTLMADHALIDMPNVIVTPHIAFNTREAKREILETTAQNIKAFVAGTPENTIS